MVNKIFILLGISQFCIAFDPITIGVGTAVAAAFGYNFDYLKEKTYCQYKECCNKNYIPYDLEGLRVDLDRNLYGQHILRNTLYSSLHSHYWLGEKSKKPLVLTFHGTAGTGKNFVSDMIVKHLYKNGHNSIYVHRYMGRLHFPQDSLIDQYRQQLKSEVFSAVSNCERSIFIFDEVDKIPKGVLDVLTSVLDHHNNIVGTNFRKSVFIFLTNTGGKEVASTLSVLMRKGMPRESAQLKHFENYCQLEAFNVAGGLQKSGAIESSLIDHYIPFLPLEPDHVKMCIKKEFERLESRRSTWEDDINNVYDEIIMDEITGLFVTSGCKRVTKKVEARIGSRHYRN